MRVFRRDAISEFEEIGLSIQHCAGAGTTPNDSCVLGRNKIRKNLRSRRAAHTADPDIVLDRDWDAVERPTVVPTHNFALGAPSVRPSPLRNNGDIGVKPGIQLLGAGKDCFGQLDRRDFLRPQEGRDAADGEKDQIAGRCSRV